MTGDLARRITTAVQEAAQIGTGAAIATAIHSVRPDDLAEFFHASLSEDIDAEPITTGLPASPGAAAGRIVLTSEAAMEAGDRGEAVILVRPETTPDDVLGMQASRGILTARGGMVSHAAVVARGWGIPAVVGCRHDRDRGRRGHVGRRTLHAGDEITIDGSSGHVYLGLLETAGADAPPELETLLGVGRRDRRRPRAGACQRRHRGRCQPGPDPRRAGNRTVPHRAHVPRRRPAADHAPIHHGPQPGGRGGRARRARRGPDRRLRDSARGDGRSARDRATARSAVARVPARPRRADRARRPRRTRRVGADPVRGACAGSARPTR